MAWEGCMLYTQKCTLGSAEGVQSPEEGAVV